jgi:hypothetical protein
VTDAGGFDVGEYRVELRDFLRLIDGLLCADATIASPIPSCPER